MELFDWHSLLAKLNRDLLTEEEDVVPYLPAAVVHSGWLGFDGASKAEIDHLQARLGTTLPPSYCQFLSISNGWRTLGPYLPGLASTSNVDWYRIHHQRLIDSWQSGGSYPVSDEDYFVYGTEQLGYNFRANYLNSALLVSNHDGVDFMLNPEIVFPDGEWEAWEFSAHIPGARRYR